MNRIVASAFIVVLGLAVAAPSVASAGNAANRKYHRAYMSTAITGAVAKPKHPGQAKASLVSRWFNRHPEESVTSPKALAKVNKEQMIESRHAQRLARREEARKERAERKALAGQLTPHNGPFTNSVR